MKSLLALLLAAVPAHAGGWISSGGELFRDAKNPWFVRNTEAVRYCVRVAEGSFSVSRDSASQLIAGAFRYWQQEFQRLDRFKLPSEGFFTLGTQRFEEVDCSRPNVDIRFLLGYDLLTPEEIAFLKEPRKYIGVTVRTDYDEESLKGKGFVFISSDRGPNAYLNSGSQIERAWQHPKLLTYVLLHEVGHIFGFPHTGSGLMSEVFLEQVINKNLYESFLKWEVESFLSPNLEAEVCAGPMTPLNTEFFTAEPGVKCLKVRPSGNQWDIYAEKEPGTEGVLVGTIKNISIEYLRDFAGLPTVLLQLTERQKVFPPKETAFRPFMVGPILASYGASGTYVVAATKQPKSVYMKISANAFSVIGSSGKNKVEPVLGYQSPLGLSLLIPPTPIFPYGQ